MNQFNEALREGRLARGDDRELAREALRQVVEHWPGDLRGVSIKAEVAASRIANGVVVTLLSTDTLPSLGRLLRFTADDLRHDSPTVGQRIRREHHEWTEGR